MIFSSQVLYHDSDKLEMHECLCYAKLAMARAWTGNGRPLHAVSASRNRAPVQPCKVRLCLASSMVYATIRFMRRPLRFVVLIGSILWAVILTCAGPPGLAAQAQEETADSVWLELVNETRLEEGLDPYGRSRLLSSAAQRHADDLAENGPADTDDVHLGSDGTDAQERIEEAGYAAWTREDGQMVAAENVWLGEGAPRDALASFLEDSDDRENLLDDAYREIGIGAAIDADGRSIYVLNFGARPNVLPIFINDGAASTENREVAIRLTNERVRPEGEGSAFIGEAIEIRISNEPSFDELAWESWAPLVSWELPDTAGEHTVYVQFRDAAGRTAASADGIILDRGAPATAIPVTPTSTPTPRAADTAPAPSATHEVTTPQESPTSAAEPGVTTPSPAPTATSFLSRATPFPTWTPLPSPGPTATDPDEPDEVTLSLPRMEGYERPLMAVGILQAVVLVLGALWLLRRGKGG